MTPMLHDQLERRKKAIRAILVALSDQDAAAFHLLRQQLALHTTENEREMLVSAILLSLPHEVAVGAVESTFQGREVVPFLLDAASIKADAEDWAANASDVTLRAYAFAAVQRMRPAILAKFKTWVAAR